MPRPPRLAPRDRVEGWPDEPAADPATERMRGLAVNLSEAIGETPLRQLAAKTGIDHGVISRILSGQTWPNLETVLKLEEHFGRELLPRRTA